MVLGTVGAIDEEAVDAVQFTQGLVQPIPLFACDGSRNGRTVGIQRSSRGVAMIRKARAVWRGSGRAGNGELSTDSGVLEETPYSFKTRFENEKGTNPEELIAAAHAGCFTMALAFQLQGAGYTPTELRTEAAVSLEPEGQGFRIRSSALTLRGVVPNLDQDAFARMAKDAEQNCPVSKVLRAEITLDAKLA
jgi:lipoyl-dependent peroxiredoxin